MTPGPKKPLDHAEIILGICSCTGGYPVLQRSCFLTRLLDTCTQIMLSSLLSGFTSRWDYVWPSLSKQTDCIDSQTPLLVEKRVINCTAGMCKFALPQGTIGPGGVQYMTAGRGIVHSEMPVVTSGDLWGFQLW